MINKIKSLETGELAHIVRKKYWVKKARLFSGCSCIPTTDRVKQYIKRDIRNNALLPYFQSHEKPFYFDRNDISTIKKIYDQRWGGLKQTIFKKADSLCRREYHLLNVQYAFKDRIDWHLEPITTTHWPKIFYQDIRYTGPNRLGDIKLPWELSRHQFLVTLGQAYCLSGDEKYADEILSIIDSWIEDNPPYIGIHWVSALEIGLRLISWVWAFHFIKMSSQITEAFIRKFLLSVWLQADYIENNLNIGRYSNNHLIGEAAALAMVGIYFYEFRRAEQWKNKGLAILKQEALKQILPDGGGAEQASSYLRFIVEFLLLAFLPAENNGVKPPSVVMSRIEKAFEFISLTLMPDGTAPKFGDSDDARAIFLGDDVYWDFRGILALGAALFRRGDFKVLCSGPSSDLLWLLGAKGIEAYDALGAKDPAKTSWLLSESGYAVMRNTWKADADYLMLDCGSLGYKSGGHGHADALSVQLAIKGFPAIIDPGTFAYNQDPDFREYFRSTRAHNTVSVDGMDQAHMSGRMMWDNHYKTIVKDHYFSAQMDMVTAENDGYQRLPSTVTHERIVLFCKDPVYYLIIDKMNGTDDHDYALNYHFLPGTDLQINDNQAVAVVSPDCNLCLSVNGSEEVTARILKGGQPAMGGWFSDGYGFKTESPTLSFKCIANGPMCFCSFVVPYQNKDPQKKMFIMNQSTESISLIIEHGSFSDFWLVNDHDKEVETQDILFCGKHLFIRKNADGAVMAAMGIDAYKLNVGQICYLDSDKPVRGNIVETNSGE